jgi:hypothetical protein
VVIVCIAGYVVLSILHTLMKAYGTSSSMRLREYLDLALCVIGPRRRASSSFSSARRPCRLWA